MTALRPQLEELAVHYGITLTFYDIKGRRYDASDEALFAVLRSLGAQLESERDIPAALAARKRALVEQVLEPVVVVWSDRPQEVLLRLPERAMSSRWTARVTTDAGEVIDSSGEIHALAFHDEWVVDGTKWVRKRFPLGKNVPHGYHRIELRVDGQTHEAMLISAPARAYLPKREKTWGLFSPTYALRSEGDRGVGTLGELARLVEHTRALGGRWVGTLPLTATFLEEPFEPSPYAPVSRLFFNELYLDIARLPELGACEEVRRTMESTAFSDELESLRARRRVDYRRQGELTRRLLAPLARTAFSKGVPPGLEAWLEAHPRATDYAMFRAAATKLRTGWSVWPERMRDGTIEASDVDPEEVRYHQWVQWRLGEQVHALVAKSEEGGGLYLDLPLGVHPDGYDAWRERDVFMEGISTGAPPDDFFGGGQDWGFKPIDPERARRSEYAYTIECFRHQLGAAGALRIDHVMGLERIYCVPHGLGAKHGVYVHHRSEETYAILTLESHRHKTMIVGEDLGTVPDSVREAMTRHAFQRMYVMQFNLHEHGDHAITPAPGGSVGSINTHDTPTFTSFWEGHEIEDRLALSHLTVDEAEAEHERRRAIRAAVKADLFARGRLSQQDATTREVLAALLEELASSDARLVLVNLEDLFLERGAQNMPGTVDEHPNWQRKIAKTLEEAFGSDEVRQILTRVDRARSLE